MCDHARTRRMDDDQWWVIHYLDLPNVTLMEKRILFISTMLEM
jgi:hypothetical protein